MKDQKEIQEELEEKEYQEFLKRVNHKEFDDLEVLNEQFKVHRSLNKEIPRELKIPNLDSIKYAEKMIGIYFEELNEGVFKHNDEYELERTLVHIQKIIAELVVDSGIAPRFNWLLKKSYEDDTDTILKYKRINTK